jgi:3-hydroxyanthranilate 3,4-dioxygenase
MIMVVGSNTRRDYHVNEGEEFFFQQEGDITLRVIDDGKIADIPIRQGEIYLLPPRVPHSPRRPPGTVGLVVETKRKPGQLDGFQWYCESCGAKLHEEFVVLTDIVAQLPPLFAKFYGDEAKRLCGCGARFPDPAPA